jgi:hypothetical protein
VGAKAGPTGDIGRITTSLKPQAAALCRWLAEKATTMVALSLSFSEANFHFSRIQRVQFKVEQYLALILLFPLYF